MRNKFDILVAYDVDTVSEDGQARLRRVATVCKNFGQRVQFSIFECRVTRAQLEELEAKLLQVINPDTDSLRIYILYGGREKCLRAYGNDRYRDFDEPLVV
ncbi:MAG: CRISPR-associated endonuclease Cas2 [Candidatus Thorarchaeota archaeon]|nr:MAG: CRISPR-associated endonuclease Cas2 [Candidatus Thorarchaeota archaeon]